jgi:hypothetical protein
VSETQELATEIGELISMRSWRHYLASSAVKLGVIAGSVVAGIAHFASEEKILSAWHLTGIAAAIGVGLCGALLLLLVPRSTVE